MRKKIKKIKLKKTKKKKIIKVQKKQAINQKPSNNDEKNKETTYRKKGL